MSAPLTQNEAHELVTGAAAALREYRSTLVMNALCDLYDGLCEMYRTRLTECTAEELPALQAAHKQCRLLRDALEPAGLTPVL